MIEILKSRPSSSQISDSFLDDMCRFQLSMGKQHLTADEGTVNDLASRKVKEDPENCDMHDLVGSEWAGHSGVLIICRENTVSI
ncbi:uncharacterized protein N7487_000286 [Penicillium crustosum]|uniref:uncharacterized protein n=1 Tax=Penicillium crustosum TaxID=36656 RepID=UPI00238CBBA8|nr:uncharacterized protein N7487_000286 [Penicillium crustosum]KAJ5416736.1 hypothetical protein N7487_000286 [Penicillium crustosum]